MSINIKFYPTGVIEDNRYSIEIKNDSIKVENHFPMNSEELVEYKGKLSNEQIHNIADLVSKIENKVKDKDPTISDTWGVTLEINGKAFYESDDFSFDIPPKNIKRLIEYIVSISPVEIDLYGFA